MLAILIICGVSLFSYCLYLHFTERKQLTKLYKTEMTRFIDNMRVLGVDDHEIIHQILKYKSLSDLKKDNKRLENSIKKYNL